MWGRLHCFDRGLFLIVGMGFFQLGAEISMMPLGEGVGHHLVRTKIF